MNVFIPFSLLDTTVPERNSRILFTLDMKRFCLNVYQVFPSIHKLHWHGIVLLEILST